MCRPLLPLRWVPTVGAVRTALQSRSLFPRSLCLSDSGQCCAFGAGRGRTLPRDLTRNGTISAVRSDFQTWRLRITRGRVFGECLAETPRSRRRGMPGLPCSPGGQLRLSLGCSAAGCRRARRSRRPRPRSLAISADKHPGCACLNIWWGDLSSRPWCARHGPDLRRETRPPERVTTIPAKRKVEAARQAAKSVNQRHDRRDTNKT
jgi:hypothetical protein